MDTGISFSNSFAELDAAIAAGATLEELYKWDTNKYPMWFKARIVAWHNLSNMIKLHSEDAVNRKQEAESKQH